MSEDKLSSSPSCESTMIETLFGPEELIEKKQEFEEILQGALPDYLFSEQSDALQAVLPLINVPHYRPKVISQKNILELIPYLDELSLFENQWGFSKGSNSRQNWCELAKIQAVPVLNKLIEVCKEQILLEPRAIYAYFHCAVEDDLLYLYQENKADVLACLKLPRLKNGFCVGDKIAKKDSGVFDSIAVVGTTMGRNASEIAKRWLLSGKSTDFKYLQGFALEMLEAMTQLTANLIAKQRCCVGDVFALGSAKKGDARLQPLLLKALNASLIDISFSRNYSMMPEFSSLSLVLPR